MAIPKAFSVRKFIFVSAIQVNNKYASGEIFLNDPAAGESENRCRRLVRKEYYVILMEKLIVSPTTFTPKVILDHEEYFLEISGESRPQDVREFYGPIFAWMDDFSNLVLNGKRKDPIIFNFNFAYFNSASAKCIVDICKVLGRLRSQEIDASAKWYYVKNDADMLEAGIEMSQIVKIPFEYVELEDL